MSDLFIKEADDIALGIMQAISSCSGRVSHSDFGQTFQAKSQKTLVAYRGGQIVGFLTGHAARERNEEYLQEGSPAAYFQLGSPTILRADEGGYINLRLKQEMFAWAKEKCGLTHYKDPHHIFKAQIIASHDVHDAYHEIPSQASVMAPSAVAEKTEDGWQSAAVYVGLQQNTPI